MTAPTPPQVQAILSNKRGRLTVLEREAIASRRHFGDSVKTLADEFNVSISTIYKIQPSQF